MAASQRTQVAPDDGKAFLADWPAIDLIASSADYYFESYNHYGVHEELLKDHVTTSSYQQAILQNAHLFRDKVVLDVACGLGVCAMFAVKAGARKVIALSTQPELLAMAQKIAAQNGFGSDVLTFLCGTASTLEQLPCGLQEVDIIVSNWMGYFMMYESRLAEVVSARDRWLKAAGGLMFPSRAKLYCALLEDAKYKQQHFEYFNEVWGFDFSDMKAAAVEEPVVNTFHQDQIITSPACILNLDLYSCQVDHCFQMASNFQVSCKREGLAHGVLCWFEVRFDSCHKPIAFATGPESPATCWKQTAFCFQDPPVPVRAGEKIRGMIAVRKALEVNRQLDVKISCKGSFSSQIVNYYRWT